MESGLADAKSFSLPWVSRQAHDNSVKKNISTRGSVRTAGPSTSLGMTRGRVVFPFGSVIGIER
jgi:hypothetical protein